MRRRESQTKGPQESGSARDPSRALLCVGLCVFRRRRVTPARVVAGRVGAKRTLKRGPRRAHRGKIAQKKALPSMIPRYLRLLALLSVDLRLCDAQGRAPAHYAAKHDRADALRQLAILDADLEVRDGYGKQPARARPAFTQLVSLLSLSCGTTIPPVFLKKGQSFD